MEKYFISYFIVKSERIISLWLFICDLHACCSSICSVTIIVFQKSLNTCWIYYLLLLCHLDTHVLKKWF